MSLSAVYNNMLNHIYEGIYFVDVDRKITFWNKGAEVITGFTADEMIGSHCFDNKLNHLDEFGSKLCLNGCPLHLTIKDGADRTTHLYLHHKDGHRVPVQVKTIPIIEDEAIVGAVEIFIHESEAFYSRFEIDDYKELSLRDQLTSLSNQKSIQERLSAELHIWNNAPDTLAVAFIDIDNLKEINQKYGNAMGDEVIRVISKTLASSIMKTDYIGRWSGDEFVCIFIDSDHDTVKIITERLRMLAENSVLRTKDGEIKVTVSIGVTFSASSDTAEAMIERASQLKQMSVEAGRNKVTIG